MKKLFCVVLVIVMSLCFVAPSFSEGSIPVNSEPYVKDFVGCVENQT